jgi:prepilin-type N-terminal cleavage/methylation domain-containing protein
MPKNLNRPKGLTLAELLIALGVYGVIAAMTIPKITTSFNNTVYESTGKEAIGAVTDAYTQYRSNNRLAAAFEPSMLLPYIGSAKPFTGIIDDNPGWGSLDCSDVNMRCVQLHNGAVVVADQYAELTGTSNLHATYVMIDVDGRYGGMTTGNTGGKAVSLLLYANGFITSITNAKTGTILFGSVIFTPWPYPDPDWFSWL